MRLHRFILPIDLNQPTVAITDPAVFHQVKNVFRLSVGDNLILCDGKNREAVATIETISSDQIICSCGEILELQPGASVAVTLYCAILKNEHFELVVEKATEVGVSAIVPVITTRTVKTNLKHERLERIAREASEQSGRGTVPTISEPVVFAEALVSAQQLETVYFFDASGKDLSDLMAERKENVALFIGPEGGWDQEEIEQAKKLTNILIVNLGSLTLRAETAAIVASYLVSK